MDSLAFGSSAEEIFLCPGCSSGNRRETSPGTLGISPKWSASEIGITNIKKFASNRKKKTKNTSSKKAFSLIFFKECTVSGL
jgi:hypothetical protein